MMGHDAQKKWLDIVTNHVTTHTQEELENCIERFLLLFMEEDISLDIKEWMSEVKKPRNMSVQDFVQRISHLNDLIDYTPAPNPVSNPGVQTPKFTDAELARIVRNACPAGWKKAQVQANLRHLSLAAQTRYYTGLKSVEPNDQSTNQIKPQGTKSSNNNRNQNSQPGMKQKTDPNLKNRSQKYCELHGKCNHTTLQCKVIQKQCEEYKNRPNDKNNKNQKNEQHRYNTRSNTKKNREENNNLSLKNQSDEVSSTGSKVNHIEEIFQVQDTNKTHNSNEINTEVRVQCHGKHTNHFMLGLLDTGATGVFIKQNALSQIKTSN
jgi:hypothetical protein